MPPNHPTTLALPPPQQPKRRRRGFRDELDEDLIEEIIEAIPRCLRLEDIAHMCRVRPRMLEHWLRCGQRPDATALEADFAARFLQTDAQYQSCWIAYWQQAVKNGKQAHSIAEFLDRRWPAEDGITKRVEAAPESNVQALLNDPPPALLNMLRNSPAVMKALTGKTE